MNLPALRQVSILAISITLSLVFFWWLGPEPEAPQKDAVRYVDYIYNLKAHNVFGLSYGEIDSPAPPSSANAPLYPWLASLMTTSSSEAAFGCLLRATERHDGPHTSVNGRAVFDQAKGAEPATCGSHINSVLLLNFLLAGVSLFLGGLLAYGITHKLAYFYLTPLFAFLAFEITDYGQRILVINLVVPLFLALQLLLLAYYRKPGWKFAAGLGAGLGLLILTRPEYMYLTPLLLALVWWRDRSGRLSIVLLIAAALLVSPWLVRNQSQLGKLAIIDSQYGGHVATERIALNEMTWPQWLVSFVYWFPDSGDKMARALFPEQAAVFDNSNSRSIFVTPDPGTIKLSAIEVLGQGFIAEPIKHMAVSVALAWRGLFVGKLWGLVAVIGLILLLRHELQARRYELLVLCLLPLYMLALRAGVSLNVSRYNVPAIGLFGMGWTYLSVTLYGRFREPG